VTNKAGIPALFRHVLLVQITVTAIMSLALSYYGRAAALSALIGGLIVVVANVYSTWRVFSTSNTNCAQQALPNLYRAEAGKLIMIAALFIAVFAGWNNVNIVAFIAGCAAVMITGLIVAATRNVDQNISRGRETDKKN